MRPRFVAPRTTEPRLPSATTLLSVVGMSNSATGSWGGHGWDQRRHLRHGGSRALGCACGSRAVEHPHGAGGDDTRRLAGWATVPRAPVTAVGSEWNPTGMESGVLSLVLRTVSCRPWAGTAHWPCPTYVLLGKLFWAVLDRDAKPGLVLLCRN